MLRKNYSAILTNYGGAFLNYKKFEIRFFAMCRRAQKFLGPVHMCIRVVSTKNACYNSNC